ncbi:YciI family protein [Halalkalibaculum sp. DA3122]|uniref:YciI family protein n=1 Tax=unclassified Halalkalibaculum TaxID=2964617 RepID=UPI0037540A89
MKPVALLLLLASMALPGWAQDAVPAEESSPEPETFQMQWEDSTVTMQKYFIVFLKSGPERSQSKEEAEEIQQQHLDYLSKVYREGHTSITGPLGDDGDIRGIVIYNTATLEQARSLAEQDPAVKAGRLVVEVHPWWAAKGSTLK